MIKKAKRGKIFVIGLLGCLVVAFSLTSVLVLPGFCAQSDPVKIIWWGSKPEPGSPSEKWNADVLKRFHARYPNIKLEFVPKIAKNFDYIITMAAAAKKGPDIFAFWCGPLTRDWVKRGDILPLDGLVSEERLNSTLGIDVMTINGKKYGIPMKTSYEILMYDKEAFKRAGLDPDVFPRYWDGFLQALEALKTSGTNPIAWADKQGWASDFYIDGMTSQNFDSAKDMVESLMKGKGSFTDSRYLDGLAHFKELYDKGFLFEGGLTEPWDGYIAQLMGRKAAIGRGAGFVYLPVRDKTGPIWGLAQYPIWRKQGKLADTVKSFPDQAYHVTSYTKHSKEAALAVEELTNMDNSNLFYELGGGIPANMKWDVENLMKDPELIKIIELGRRKPGVEFYVLYPTEAIWNAIVKNISLYLLEEITAEEYGKRLDEARIEAEE